MTPRCLAILMWSADLSQPERVATPFVMAQAAAALDMPVEMYFTAQTVRLLLPESQSTRVGFGSEQLPLSHYIAQAQEGGIVLMACSQALHACGIERAQLIPSCAGLGGAVQFMSRCADPAWSTLVF